MLMLHQKAARAEDGEGLGGSWIVPGFPKRYYEGANSCKRKGTRDTVSAGGYAMVPLDGSPLSLPSLQPLSLSLSLSREFLPSNPLLSVPHT